MSIIAKPMRSLFTALGMTAATATTVLADEPNHYYAMIAENCSALIQNDSLDRLSFIEEYLEDTRKNGWDIHPKVQEAIIGWAQGRYGGPQMLSQDTIAKLESTSSQQEFKDALKDTLPDEAFLIRFTANALCPNGGMP